MLREGEIAQDTNPAGAASGAAVGSVATVPIDPVQAAPLERLLFRPVPLWSLLAVALVGLIVMIGFGAIVDGAEKSGTLGNVALQIARIPDTIMDAFKGPQPYYGGTYERLPGGFWRNPAGGFVDPGYALISPFDEARGRSVVRLMRLSDGATVREYVPDVDAANARSHFVSALTDVRRDKRAPLNRLMHPLLMPDGGLVVHDSSPLARYDACGRLLWSIDGIFSHSTELGPDGTIWVPYRYPNPKQPGVKPTFWDDAVAQVSPDGKLLRLERAADILERNGLGYLWRGRPYIDDPFHLNDIQPVLQTGTYWQRGDLFLSMRNLSLVALYRPSTGRILWSRQAPWRFQHDVTILDDHRISVFDNNISHDFPDDAPGGTNQLIVYDFATGQASAPYAAGFARNQIVSRAQGRGTPLPNGDAMIEETEQGRLMRMAPDGTLRWRYISADSAMRRMALSWARYLSPSTDGAAIQAAVNAKCT